MKQKTSLQLHEFLPYRLSVLSNRISSLIATTYESRFGLRIPEWRVIAVLGETPGLNATEIALRTAMDKVAVSRAVSDLVSKGLVYRGASQSDGRISHLHLSEAGKQIYSEIVPLALSYEQRIFSVLDDESLIALGSLIDGLMHRIDELATPTATK